MTPTVSDIISKLFYAGRLSAHPCVSDRGLVFTKQEGSSVKTGRQRARAARAILVFNLGFGSARWNRISRSFENPLESLATTDIYQFLLRNFQNRRRSKLTDRGICVLSPFNQQTKRLRADITGVEMRDQWKYDKRQDKKIQEDSLDGTSTRFFNIDTVDKFQGSERDAVIVSLVMKSSTAGGGRTADPHFINVACSRAKHLLVLVGRVAELAQDDPIWQSILEYASDSNSCQIFNCQSPADVGIKLQDWYDRLDGRKTKL